MLIMSSKNYTPRIAGLCAVGELTKCLPSTAVDIFV